MKAFLICSGGLDSVTLAYELHAQNALSGILSFHYNQRHKRELDYARLCAEKLKVPFHLIDIGSIGKALSGSALTDDIDVPEGHYAEANMALTVVPNRNAIFLSIAFGIAAAKGAKGASHVALAVHGGDHFIYPDCRPDFIEAFDRMEQKSLEGTVRLYAPYINISKSDIVARGTKLNIPYEETWSCYKGGNKHCGRCGTCIERHEAFSCACVVDPTDYEAAEAVNQEGLK